MATPLDITALETSFDLVAARREELVDRFYRRLFSDAPATRALFVHADMRAQKRALLGALVALRRSLRDLSSIAPFLSDLGARHVQYGVCADPASAADVGAGHGIWGLTCGNAESRLDGRVSRR
jgi:hemoglobin-like flavoprotein